MKSPSQSHDVMMTKARNTISNTSSNSPMPPISGSGGTTTEIASRDGRVRADDEELLTLPVIVPIDNPSAPPVLPIDMTVVTRNLWLFIWLKTIGSHDSGAFSAAIASSNGIAESWGLSYARQGTLTSSVFLGNVIGCPLAGKLFSSYDEKNVLAGSLVIHTVFTFLFALFSNYYVALVNRFFIGLTLAFIVVYTPVWVDEFAPKDRQSVWMASHNAGVPLGIMMGYLLAAFFPTYTNIGWEWAFYVKCVLMIPTILYVMKVDKRTINTQKKTAAAGLADQADHESDACIFSPDDDEVHVVVAPAGSHGGVSGALNRWWARLVAEMRALWLSLKPIMTNVIFMCSVLAMSSLYFVATGLQNFVTQYLREPPFNASMRTIMAGFGASVVTAPVCGVVVGGILLDRIGGYHRNLFRVSLFACAWGVVAALMAVICIFVTTTTGFLIVMSLLLFCGGAIIPPGLGLTMSTLAPHLRSMAAAFSQTLYNLLGNFSGPLICGQVAEWTGDLKYGIMVLLLSSVLGVIPMGVIFLMAWRARRAAGPHLDVPDAVAAVSTMKPGHTTELSPMPPQTHAMMQNESFIRRSHGGVDGEDELHEGLVIKPPAPFPLTASASSVTVMPPGRVQLTDAQNARWVRPTTTTTMTTTTTSAVPASAHFSPLRSTFGTGTGTSPIAAAPPTMAECGGNTGTAGSHARSEHELTSASDLGVPPDMQDESTHVLQAMPTPYLFGMDVVRTLLHPPASTSSRVGHTAESVYSQPTSTPGRPTSEQYLGQPRVSPSPQDPPLDGHNPN